MGRDAKLRLQLDEALESWYRKAGDAGDEELSDQIVVLSSWCYSSCSDCGPGGARRDGPRRLTRRSRAGILGMMSETGQLVSH